MCLMSACGSTKRTLSSCPRADPRTLDLFAIVSAAAVFAPCGLPLLKIDDIGVFEHVAHVWMVEN